MVHACTTREMGLEIIWSRTANVRHKVSFWRILLLAGPMCWISSVVAIRSCSLRPRLRFNSFVSSSTITSSRKTIKWSRKTTESGWERVVYGEVPSRLTPLQRSDFWKCTPHAATPQLQWKYAPKGLTRRWQPQPGPKYCTYCLEVDIGKAKTLQTISIESDPGPKQKITQKDKLDAGCPESIAVS